MSVYSAPGWYVIENPGISADYFGPLTGLQRYQTVLQSNDGHRAEQAAGIDFGLQAHARCHSFGIADGSIGLTLIERTLSSLLL